MDYIIPGLLKKSISFRRLPNKAVKKYKIYALYKDDSYASGIRTELLETIDNPYVPQPYVKRITLPYNENATWKLPRDAYLDVGHKFRLYLDDIMVGTMSYKFNRITRMVTLDTVIETYDVNSKIEMEYYQDLIKKDYMLEEDCDIRIEPVFAESSSYGFHNVII